MRKPWFLPLLILTASCDVQHEANDHTDSIDGQTVMGAIAPDTVYRGYYIAQGGDICGLVLIEAERFPEDASITFNSSFDPPGFEATGGVRTDCVAGEITFVDLVTGQSHTVTSPGSITEAESYTRDHIELLLL